MFSHSHKKHKFSFLQAVVTVLVFCVSSRAWSTLYDISWSNTLLYNQDRLDTLFPGLKFYESINLGAYRVGGSDLTLIGNFDYANGLREPDRKQLEINTLYLDWDNAFDVVDMRLGRQNILATRASGYIDGLFLRSSFSERVEATAYGGIRLPSRYTSRFVTTNPDSVATAVGVLVRALINDDHAIAAAFDQSIAESSPATTTGATGATGRLVGVDYDGRFGPHFSANTELVYNMTEETVDKFYLAGFWDNLNALQCQLFVNGAYNSFDTLSGLLAAVIKDYVETGFEAVYGFNTRQYFKIGYLIRVLQEEDTPVHDVHAGLDYSNFAFSLNQGWGAGGLVSGAQGQVRFFGTRFTEFESGFQFNRYLVDNSPAYAWAGALGVRLFPGSPWFGSHIGIQVLRNRYYQYDARAFLTTNVQLSRFEK